MLDDEDVVSISVIGENEGVGSGLNLHKTIVLEILKLPGPLVEPLQDTDPTVLVPVASPEPARGKVKRVVP